jgi:hypothetical protein
MGLKRKAHVVARSPEWAADPGGPIRIRFVAVENVVMSWQSLPPLFSQCLFDPKATPVASKKKLPKYTGKQKLTAAARILFFHKLFFNSMKLKRKQCGKLSVVRGDTQTQRTWTPGASCPS